MSFRYPYQDPASERLLLVVLEDSEYSSKDYRHIRATVIRRAVPHKLRADAPAIYDGTGVEVWNDDHAQRCSGYRVASYVKHARQDIYVDDMQVRGQIDTGQHVLNEGKPYCNEVYFKPHSVDTNSAKGICNFFKKWDAFKAKYNLSRRGDDFYVELDHLAQFLKITKVVFFKPGVRHASLAEAQCYDEVDIAFAKTNIDNMLAQFYRPEK